MSASFSSKRSTSRGGTRPFSITSRVREWSAMCWESSSDPPARCTRLTEVEWSENMPWMTMVTTMWMTSRSTRVACMVRLRLLTSRRAGCALTIRVSFLKVLARTNSVVLTFCCTMECDSRSSSSSGSDSLDSPGSSAPAPPGTSASAPGPAAPASAGASLSRACGAAPPELGFAAPPGPSPRPTWGIGATLLPMPPPRCCGATLLAELCAMPFMKYSSTSDATSLSVASLLASLLSAEASSSNPPASRRKEEKAPPSPSWSPSAAEVTRENRTT
mmetsp:Transcript_40561/g.129333  ORF Transcript_40561/g.129333 Transcript_40561/m.129333 type:complete len:275 (-) Transcript_40561:3837-4661(-)